MRNDGGPSDGHLITGEALFFDPSQWKVVAAIADRIFPADSQSPGAAEAHVTTYIDRQLASEWGRGEGIFRQGPFFEPNHAGHGWQTELTPAEFYRTGLELLQGYVQTAFGASFDELSASRQDQVLRDLASGRIPGWQSPRSNDFFSLLRQNVIEGLFADPVYGGNAKLIGWRWVGFPGDPTSYGEPYRDNIDRFDDPYIAEPKSM